MTAPRLVPPIVAAGWPNPLALARSAAAALQARPGVAALASAALLWASYFPLNFAPLAWVALVPVLTLVCSAARPRIVYLSAWLCGLAFFIPALQWLRVADLHMYFTWAGLSLYCSAYLPLALFLLRRLDRGWRLPLALTVPAVWVPLEWFRGHFGSGFPWYFLGHSQHGFLPLIQVADLGGAYAVTALVAGANGALTDWLLPAPARPRVRTAATVGVALLLGGSLGYGAWQLSQNEFTDGPRLALIQSNLPQQLKDNRGLDMVGQVRGLADRAAAGQPRPDLIVWPETTYFTDLLVLDPDLPRSRLNELGLQALREGEERLKYDAAHWRSALLLGLNTYEQRADGPKWRRNSALLVSRQGEAVARYDKMHCVPFGEYVPFRHWAPWLQNFTPYEGDYSLMPGESFTAFATPAADGRVYRFGVLICYEDSVAELASAYTRPGGPDGHGPVDFLINISNDGWFDGTEEHEEHLAIARFRAVECRRAVARSVNMGISAVIDPNGRVVALPAATWAGSKKVAAVVSAAIPIDARASLYAAWGDWLPAALALALLVGLTIPWLGRFVRR